MSEEKAPFVVEEQGEANTRSEAAKQADDEILAKVGRIVEEKMSSKLDEWNRQQQGLRRKTADKIRKETQAQLEALKAIGITPTDEQTQAIRKTVQERISDEFEAEETKAEPQVHEPQRQNNVTQAVDDYVLAMKEEYGVVINKGDPEASEVNTSSLQTFYLTYRKAVEKAAQRRNTPAQARIPAPTGGAVSNPTAEQYKSDMLAARGNKTEIMRIQEKYQKAGVDIGSVKLFSG